LGTPSLKVQLKKANRINARYVVIVGVMEARNGKLQLRDMDAGTQEEIEKDNLIDYII
jgi:histidyl-tRNA synthetase